MASRVALITGSTSGIGLGIAKTLSSKFNVVLHGIASSGEIQDLKQDFKENHGQDVEHFGADLTSSADMKDMCRACLDRYGRVDVLVNNAGFQHISTLEKFPEDVWRKMMDVMLTAPFVVTKELLPGMIANGWGRVVNIASVHGLVASPTKGAYVAAKHGLVGFTRALGVETAGTGVTANAICPGFVETALTRSQFETYQQENGIATLEEATKQFVGQFQPLGKPSTPAQIGGLVEFLCSDMTSQMTGSCLTIDGAWTAR